MKNTGWRVFSEAMPLLLVPLLGWIISGPTWRYAVFALVWVLFCVIRLCRSLPTAVFVPNPEKSDSAEFAAALALCRSRAQQIGYVLLAIDATSVPSSWKWMLDYDCTRGVVAGRVGRTLVRVSDEESWIADHPCPLVLCGGRVFDLAFRAISPTRVRVDIRHR